MEITGQYESVCLHKHTCTHIGLKSVVLQGVTLGACLGKEMYFNYFNTVT